MIPSHTITIVLDRPELAVYHELGRNAWCEVREDGGLTVDSEENAAWTVYQDSTTALPSPAPDIPDAPRQGSL